MNTAPDMTAWYRFLRTIRSKEDGLGNPQIVWYRGVTDESHQLVPSLFRIHDGIGKEQALFTKFMQIASRVLKKRNNDWEYLFDMQHHYIPTRLLDWTEVLGIAVFFALMGDPTKTAAIYILDPLLLNTKSAKNNIPMVSDEGGFDYRMIYWHNTPVRPTLPLAVDPPYQNSRIQAQRGRFTIHGNDPQPIETVAPDCVARVILDKDVKEGAKEFLRLSGIDEFSMFPDIVGMVPFIKRIVGL